MEPIESLSPREFEDLVASYLREQGYSAVQRVGGAGDLGVDIRCTDAYGRLVVVQCKHYTSGAKVGSPEIQHFFGMVVHAGAARGIFATSSEFTAPAIRLAEDRDIQLIDGAAIRLYWAGVAHRKREVEERLQRVLEEHRRKQSESMHGSYSAPQAANPPTAAHNQVLTVDPPKQNSSLSSPRAIVPGGDSRPEVREPFSLGLFLFVCIYVFWFKGIGIASTISVVLLLASGDTGLVYIAPLALSSLTFLVLPFAADIWIHSKVPGTSLITGIIGSSLNAAVLVMAANGAFLLRGYSNFGLAIVGLVVALLILESWLGKGLETLPEEEWPKWINRAYAIARLLAVAGFILWGIQAFS